MKPHELSEIVLLGVRCYVEQSKWAEALEFITHNYSKIVDTVSRSD